MVLSDKGMLHRGKMVEDAGEAHAAFMAVMKQMQEAAAPAPAEQGESVGQVIRYGRNSHGAQWHGAVWRHGLDLPAGTKLYTHHTHAPVAQGEPVATTYVNERGDEVSERRSRSRDGDDPRIAHLFNGFDCRIESAQINFDKYAEGYLLAMRAEFAGLVADLHAAPAPVPLTPAQQHAEELMDALRVAAVALAGAAEDLPEFCKPYRVVSAAIEAVSQKGGE
jgi:hypothetical protein